MSCEKWADHALRAMILVIFGFAVGLLYLAMDRAGWRFASIGEVRALEKRIEFLEQNPATLTIPDNWTCQLTASNGLIVTLDPKNSKGGD